MNKNCTDGLSLLLTNIARIHSNIRFADAKAGVVLLVNSSLLGVLFSRIKIDSVNEIDLIANLPAIIAAILLIISLGLALAVVRPRSEDLNIRGPGLVDPVRISQYDSDKFIKEISGAKYDVLIKQTQELTWDVSKIDRKKYHSLKIALYFSMAAWVVSIFSIVFNTLCVTY